MILEIQRATGIEPRSVDGSGIVTGNCPGCDCRPFTIATHPPQDWDDHTMRAGARCVNCGDAVGWVYVDRPTIFGAEEDRNVLEHGRARVY